MYTNEAQDRKVFKTLLNIVMLLFLLSVGVIYSMQEPAKDPINVLYKYDINLPCRTADGIRVNVNMSYYITIKESELSEQHQYVLNNSEGLAVLSDYILRDQLELGRNFIYLNHADTLVQNSKRIADKFFEVSYIANQSGFVIKDIIFNALEFEERYKEYITRKVQAQQEAELAEMELRVQKAIAKAEKINSHGN